VQYNIQGVQKNKEIVGHRVRYLDILGEKGKGAEQQQAQSNAKR